MTPLSEIGRVTLLIGLLFVLIGGGIWLLGQIPGIDRFPGTLSWEGERWKVVVPLGAMIVLSVVLTLLLNVVARLFR